MRVMSVTAMPLRGMAWRMRALASCVLALAAFTVGLRDARADGLSALEDFLRNVRGGRAEFTQAVTSPGRDGQAPRVRNSSGSFEFQRPSRFRFTYRKPFEQTIVADGQTLWVHDVDLKQVTARPQAQALGSTPAAVIAAAPDLNGLRPVFAHTALP